MRRYRRNYSNNQIKWEGGIGMENKIRVYVEGIGGEVYIEEGSILVGLSKRF